MIKALTILTLVILTLFSGSVGFAASENIGCESEKLEIEALLRVSEVKRQQVGEILLEASTRSELFLACDENIYLSNFTFSLNQNTHRLYLFYESILQ